MRQKRDVVFSVCEHARVRLLWFYVRRRVVLLALEILQQRLHRRHLVPSSVIVFIPTLLVD